MQQPAGHPPGAVRPGQTLDARSRNTAVSVLVADDDVGVAQAFARCLGLWYHLAGVVTTLESLPTAVRLHAPHILVLDLSFADRSSLRILPEVRRVSPATRVVMLTVHTDPVLVEAAFIAGAHGYVSKQADLAELPLAIDEVLLGRSFVSPLVYTHKPDGIPVLAELRPLSRLQPTPRQLDVLRLLRFGYSNGKVAERLGIAVKTVDDHLHDIRELTGISSRALLIRWAEHLMTAPS
ncbi:MAG TPA: response regulator transcription factor [Gemmatimonadales bacterium]|jgi:DNA-binding NarL/FixJ family response regulator|nr:response regulator transcription factor [Gemmatimonadales bacterium]